MLKRIVSLLIVLSLCAGAAFAVEEWEPFPMNYFEEFGLGIDDWTTSSESRALAAAMMLDAFWLANGDGDEEYWNELCNVSLNGDAVLARMEGELCPMLVCYYTNPQDYLSLYAYFRENEPDIECYVASSFASVEEIVEYLNIGMTPYWIVPQAELADALGQ